MTDESAGEAETQPEDAGAHANGVDGVEALLDYLEAPGAGSRQKSYERYRQASRRPDYPEELVAAQREYAEVEAFKPGDLVQWKRLMRTNALPRYGAPAVVVEVISEDSRHSRGRGLSGLHQELGDIIIGVIDGDDRFVLIRTSRNRLTHWC